MPSAPARPSYDYPLQPWLVCFSAALFFFFEFMQVNMFNALDPALIQTFHMSAIQLGHLSANYFYATVIFLFPAGMILDRVSTRKVIILAMLASVLCTFGFALSHAVWQAELCRFITGIGGSFCLLANVRLASRWFDSRRLALVIGLVVTFAMVGGMAAQTPFTVLTDKIGWRMTLLVDGCVGLLMLGVIFLFVKNFPPGSKQSDEHQQLLSGIGFWGALFQTIRNPQNWLGGLYTSLMNLPVFLLGANWGSLYLVQIRHLGRPEASIVTSMLFVGVIIGSPALGWFSDKIRRRRSPMIAGAVLSLLLVLFLIYAANLSFVALAVIFLALGFITSTQVISYPLIAESNSIALTGTAEGLASTLIMAGGFTVPFFPRLLDLHWDHHLVNHVPVYSLSDFRLALLMMPIGFVVALIISFAVRETRCVQLRSGKTQGASLSEELASDGV